MSDKSSRSARPSGQRRNDGAPSWWAALERADLPDNEAARGAPPLVRGRCDPWSRRKLTKPRPRGSRRQWYQAVLIGLLVALVVALVLVVAGLGLGAHDALT